jgi:hypothetical protein
MRVLFAVVCVVGALVVASALAVGPPPQQTPPIQCGAFPLGTIIQNAPFSTQTSTDFGNNSKWTVCYDELYRIPANNTAPRIHSQCENYTHLLIGCYTTEEGFLTVGSAAPASVIFQTTPPGEFIPGNPYGSVQYYYTESMSMGFAPIGEPLDRMPCDRADDLADAAVNKSSTTRMCWHLQDLAGGGGRCGSAKALSGSRNVHRIVFGSNECPPPENPCVPQEVFRPCVRTRLFSTTNAVSFSFSADGIACTPPGGAP